MGETNSKSAINTQKPIIIGVDPGLSGAISFLNAKTHELNVYDLPLEEIRGKKQVSGKLLANIVGIYSAQVRFALVEEVGVMSGREGTVSMFRFGFGAGVVNGVIASHTIPIIYIKPAVWKMSMGLSHDKSESRVRASSLFPTHKDLWKRVKDDGRAESALLSWFAMIKLG